LKLYNRACSAFRKSIKKGIVDIYIHKQFKQQQVTVNPLPPLSPIFGRPKIKRRVSSRFYPGERKSGSSADFRTHPTTSGGEELLVERRERKRARR